MGLTGVTGVTSVMAVVASAWVVASSVATAQPPAKDAKPSTPSTPSAAPFKQEVPVAAYLIDMVPIPGSADGKVKPFYISKKEITWDVYDVFVFNLDVEQSSLPEIDADIVTRPSKPYIPPDRGFGHEGFAVISVHFKNVQEFCDWLSVRTGRVYRLPTEDEWEHAARAGGDPKSPYGKIPADKLGEYAWYASNSQEAPKAVGTKQPNAWGLYDMLGNVQEWVVGRDGKPTTKGGAFDDPASELVISKNASQEKSWNSTDPQVPKSKWWMSDAPFQGFRIVCEQKDGAPAVYVPVKAQPADATLPSTPAPDTPNTPATVTPGSPVTPKSP
jgi:hypothetical protein